MNKVKRKCGACHGSGQTHETDGVGGKWYERCYQCRGTREVWIIE